MVQWHLISSMAWSSQNGWQRFGMRFFRSVRKKDKAESSNGWKGTKVRNRKQAKRKTTMKNRMVQKLMIGLVALCALIGLMAVSGCDPEKIGGGGHLQPYNRFNGQYKRWLCVEHGLCHRATVKWRIIHVLDNFRWGRLQRRLWLSNTHNLNGSDCQRLFVTTMNLRWCGMDALLGCL